MRGDEARPEGAAKLSAKLRSASCSTSASTSSRREKKPSSGALSALAARSRLARGSRGPGENAQSVSDHCQPAARIREKSHLEGRAPTRTHGTHRHCDTLTRACATTRSRCAGDAPRAPACSSLQATCILLSYRSQPFEETPKRRGASEHRPRDDPAQHRRLHGLTMSSQSLRYSRHARVKSQGATAMHRQGHQTAVALTLQANCKHKPRC